jgi:hypothetical protein
VTKVLLHPFARVSKTTNPHEAESADSPQERVKIRGLGAESESEVNVTGPPWSQHQVVPTQRVWQLPSPEGQEQRVGGKGGITNDFAALNERKPGCKIDHWRVYCTMHCIPNSIDS